MPLIWDRGNKQAVGNRELDGGCQGLGSWGLLLNGVKFLYAGWIRSRFPLCYMVPIVNITALCPQTFVKKMGLIMVGVLTTKQTGKQTLRDTRKHSGWWKCPDLDGGWWLHGCLQMSPNSSNCPHWICPALYMAGDNVTEKDSNSIITDYGSSDSKGEKS